jgi:hypothetical protein
VGNNLNNGSGIPLSHVTSVAVADFNGDGKIELVTVDDRLYRGAIVTVWTVNTCRSAGPNLAIVRSGPALTVSWPFPSAGYILESSTGLNATSWRPTDTVPVNKNGQWEVTMPTTQSQGYFRLRKP